MATKQQAAINRALTKQKKQTRTRNEKHVLELLIAAILILLYLLLAQHLAWWPYRQATLGSAFYTNISATAAKTQPATSPAGTSSGTSTQGASTSSSGSSGSTNSTGTTTSSGSGTTSSSSTPAIVNFAAGVNVGDTKTQTNGQATGLTQNCAVLVNVSTTENNLGQQQVCTYTEGNMIVTVTYLNGKVISASKSGF